MISCRLLGEAAADLTSVIFWPDQSYGVDHLLTFANLRQLGLLVEQQPGETLTVMESKVGKLVNDKTAGDELGCVEYDKAALTPARNPPHPLYSTSSSRKADGRLLFARQEEQLQSAEQKTQPGLYRSACCQSGDTAAIFAYVTVIKRMNRFSVKVPKSDEEYDLRVPRDMAYIFSGAYIPLSCKLIEQVGNTSSSL